MNKKSIGNLGEIYAGKFLISRNYKILSRNFSCAMGEIDIIAVDLTDNELVFVEVKARTSDIFGEPEDAVDFRKRLKILKTALYFINSATGKLPFNWRVDVISIKLGTLKEITNLRHIKNIFNG
ncbi:YraN family protein [Candidatus Peregrinibacteria bacterium]|nr:YraN family protein [Candidatus Peregrinibacteria bacterium]